MDQNQISMLWFLTFDIERSFAEYEPEWPQGERIYSLKNGSYVTITFDYETLGSHHTLPIGTLLMHEI